MPPRSTRRISRRSGRDRRRRLWSEPPVTSRSLCGPKASAVALPSGGARHGARRSAVPGEEQDAAGARVALGEPLSVRAEPGSSRDARVSVVQLRPDPVHGQDACHRPAPQDLDREAPRLGRVGQLQALARVGERGRRDSGRSRSGRGRAACPPRRAAPRPVPGRGPSRFADARRRSRSRCRRAPRSATPRRAVHSRFLRRAFSRHRAREVLLERRQRPGYRSRHSSYSRYAVPVHSRSSSAPSPATGAPPA